MPYTVLQTAWFEIDGIPSSCEGWECEEPMALLNAAPQRGQSLLVPRAHGRLARRRWSDELEVTIRLRVFGDSDPEGTPYTDQGEGLVANLAFLRDAWGEPVATAPYTRTCVLHTPNGGEFTAEVQTELEWAPDVRPPVADVALTVTVPAGRLVAA
jgi:hypothetical protein